MTTFVGDETPGKRVIMESSTDLGHFINVEISNFLVNALIGKTIYALQQVSEFWLLLVIPKKFESKSLIDDITIGSVDFQGN